MKRILLLLLTFRVIVNLYSVNIERIKIKEVLNMANSVAEWQIEAYPYMDEKRYWKSYGDLSWENGVFLSALSDWANYINSESLIEWCENIAKRNYFSTNIKKNRIYYADDFAVCLLYCDMYEKYSEDYMLHNTIARMDFTIKYPSKAKLYMNTDNCFDRWSWADALYMAPPLYSRISRITGDDSYVNFMNNEFWKTYDFLFDKDENLFYRDSNYFLKKEKNGSKVFWGRGNAWVLAGICMILENMDKNFMDREKYIELYKRMINRVIQLQDKEKGYWHASLLDPVSYPNPEMSSTGFYTYSIWWGINNGLLGNEYLEYGKKGWNALVNAVSPEGKLGYVQPVGADPQNVTKDMTEVYGAGALIKAAKEILIYLNK